MNNNLVNRKSIGSLDRVPINYAENKCYRNTKHKHYYEHAAKHIRAKVRDRVVKVCVCMHISHAIYELH